MVIVVLSVALDARRVAVVLEISVLDCLDDMFERRKRV
jgi:hypothetical protein